MTVKRNVLGRGLSALLEDRDQVDMLGTGSALQNRQNQGSSGLVAGIQTLPIELIDVNPYQPRNDFNLDSLQELASSIQVHGIIQPITVRLLETNRYQLISGERRLRASKIAGLTQIPAFIRTAADQGMHEMALIENIQRENLNSLEVALSLQRMLEECNLKQEELGERVSKSRSTIANYLRLLKLPEQIQAGIREDKITMGHAKALINIELIDRQLHLYHQILDQDLSVRKTEALARMFGANGTTKPNSITNTDTRRPNSKDYDKIQDRLSSHFGTKVLLKVMGDDRGKIEIPFLSTPDLNRILELFNE